MEKIKPIINNDELICPKCEAHLGKNSFQCLNCHVYFYTPSKLKNKNNLNIYGNCDFCRKQMTYGDLNNGYERVSSDNKKICTKCLRDFSKLHSKHHFVTGDIIIGNYSSNIIEETLKYIVCPKCNNTISTNNNRYCAQCGYELNPPEIIIEMVCKKCGSNFSKSMKYCPDDGTKLTKQKTEISQQSNKSVTSKNDQIEPEIQNLEIDSKNKIVEYDKELGFFWGNAWIVLATITGLILFFGGLMILRESNNGAFFGLSFPFFISAFGVYKRKLLLGLYFTNVLLIMNLFINIAMLLKISDNFSNYMLLLIIHTLWGVYFYSRRELFIN